MALGLTDYLWIEALRKALKRNQREPYSRYFQLASLDTNSQPRVRTVVYRGLDEDGESPLFVTDTRSAKMHNLHKQIVEACWYFPISREQFRIAGQASIFPAAHRQQSMVWQGLSDAARSQFLWPAPGDSVVAESKADSEPLAADLTQAPSSFCVVAIRPERIDHLRLANPQTRMISERAREPGEPAQHWWARAVNP